MYIQNIKFTNILLIVFIILIGNACAKKERSLVRYDRRILLVGDNDAVIDVSYNDIRSVGDSSLVANVAKVSSKDSSKTPGVIFIHLTEWKADHGKENVDYIAFYDPAKKDSSLISVISNSTSNSFSGNFLSQKDWVDKYYGAPIPSGYDSVYVVIGSTTDGLFGMKAIKYSTTYIVFPKKIKTKDDLPAFRKFLDSILGD